MKGHLFANWNDYIIYQTLKTLPPSQHPTLP